MARTYNNIVNNLYRRENSLNKNFNSSNQIVKSFFNLSNSLYRNDVSIHRACVNAIKFSDDGEWLISGGDDMFVMVSNIEHCMKKNYKPLKCKLQHRGNIFVLDLNHDFTKLFSGGIDEQLIIHDAKNGDLITSRFVDCGAVINISMHPQHNDIFSFSGVNGGIYLFDCRINEVKERIIDELKDIKSIQYNPMMHHQILVTSNNENEVNLIDLRNNKIVFEYSSPFSLKGALCARYNMIGNQILVMRNQSNTSLYNSNSSNCICEFDNFGFFTSNITSKGLCFVGMNSEYACMPSDDFNIHLYKIPNNLINCSQSNNEEIKFVNSADFILRGHRSIINQVEYNHRRSIIGSSGIESKIKLFSPFPLNLNDELKKENLSSTYAQRLLNPYSYSSRGSFLIEDEYNSQSNSIEREDTEILDYFDAIIHRSFSNDEHMDLKMFKSNFNNSIRNDLQFEHKMRYIKSIVSDYKCKGAILRKKTIKQLKREENYHEKNPEIVTSRSISYILNNKKIERSKIILKRASKLIKDRLKYIKKCKDETKPNEFNDEWLSNVQKMVDSEPQLKQLSYDLCEMYEDKKIIHFISLPLTLSLFKRLENLIYTNVTNRVHNRNRQLSFDSTDQEDSIDNNDDNNNNATTNQIENKQQIDEQNDDTDESIETNSDLFSLENLFSFENNKLLVKKLLSDQSSSSTDESDQEYELKRRSLKRKKSDESSDNYSKYASSNSSSSSSDSDSDDSFIKIKKYKKKYKKLKIKIKKKRNYNLFLFDSAFDSDLDLDTSSSSSIESTKSTNSTNSTDSTNSTNSQTRELSNVENKAVDNKSNQTKTSEQENKCSTSKSTDCTKTYYDVDKLVKREFNPEATNWMDNLQRAADLILGNDKASTSDENKFDENKFDDKITDSNSSVTENELATSSTQLNK